MEFKKSLLEVIPRIEDPVDKVVCMKNSIVPDCNGNQNHSLKDNRNISFGIFKYNPRRKYHDLRDNLLERRKRLEFWIKCWNAG